MAKLILVCLIFLITAIVIYQNNTLPSKHATSSSIPQPYSNVNFVKFKSYEQKGPNTFQCYPGEIYNVPESRRVGFSCEELDQNIKQQLISKFKKAGTSTSGVCLLETGQVIISQGINQTTDNVILTNTDGKKISNVIINHPEALNCKGLILVAKERSFAEDIKDIYMECYGGPGIPYKLNFKSQTSSEVQTHNGPYGCK